MAGLPEGLAGGFLFGGKVCHWELCTLSLVVPTGVSFRRLEALRRLKQTQHRFQASLPNGEQV